MQTAVDYESANAPTFSALLTDANIKLTPAAQSIMAQLYADVADEMKAIRVFVSGGGCGGMTYGMTFTDEQTEYDCVLKGEGFDIYVDAVALNFLQGVEIDYIEQPMGGAKFVFNNVFAATGGSGVCGACGAAGGGCGAG